MQTITVVSDIIIYAIVAFIFFTMTVTSSKKAVQVFMTVCNRLLALMAVAMAVVKFGIFVGWWI